VAAVVGLLVLLSWRFRFIERGVYPPVDLYLYFYPIYEATYARIAHGVLPLWNPYQLCGIPWVATLQGGFFYPGHALYLLLPLHRALEASHGLHLLLVGIATAAFARRLGLGWAASVLASVLFGLRGFIPLSLPSANYLDAAAWMPVGALAVLEIVRRPSAWAVALLAAATGCSFLGGYPQPTVYMLYTWATLLPALLLHERADARRWLVAGTLCAAGVALGVLAAAIQLAPTLELIRSGRHLDLRPEVMAPFGTLSPGMLILGTAITGGPFSYGVAALALAGVALLTRRHRALAVWAIGLCVVTALLALGTQTPLFALYRLLPFLGMFRFPDRILSMTDFALAIAAAIGLDTVVGTGVAEVRRHRAAAVVGLLVVGAVVWLATHGGAGADRLLQVRLVAVAVAAMLVLTFVRAGTRPLAVGAVLVLLAVVDISLGGWTHRIAYDTKDIAALGRYEQTYRTVAAQAGPDRVWFYGDIAIQPSFAQKLATRYGLRAIDDYEPLNPLRQDEYFTFFTEGTPVIDRAPWLFAGSITTLESPPGVAPPATRRRLLDLASLRFVVVPPASVARHPEVATFLRDAGLEPRPLAEPDLALYENPNALPRAFTVHHTLPAPDTATLLAALSQPTFDPRTLSYVEGDTGLAPAPDAPRGGPAQIVDDGERVVEVDAELDQPGLVVLADAYYPGWIATVDGVPAPILPTNHLFRGVPAPAGTHRVRFEYRPWSVILGATGSAVGWVMILLLAWRGWAVHRRASDNADAVSPVVRG
jgi:hypothetical protein